MGASKALWLSGFPTCHRRGRHQENIVRRALRSNELGCPLIISFRSAQINRRISTIPNAIDPRFESRKMPYAAFDSSDNQAVLGRPLTNCNCRVGRKLHHDASIEGKKVIRRIVDARTIDVHRVVSIQSDCEKFIFDCSSRLRTTPMAALRNGCRLVRSWPKTDSLPSVPRKFAMTQKNPPHNAAGVAGRRARAARGAPA
ncbi:hypothetical protein BCCR75502_01679 [Burkholderia sola]|nr:hypothetical protein BCCR75389_01664 [Burkholderia cenocepacia]CAG2272572.1 hypothetical protein BCCR75386_01681 [Burkholderia cenocepacia]CAG2272687.1 hypothetical protein BCCR75388_01682 [Burkholderia cenocepacia]CAG2272932.1 hypothetical protein BCCR75384_01680 [Burkholderia cenocepacia]CAG2272998.1 hypothetical protein BCCR75387_01681 [Burkholderia cenocepacia]